MRGESSIGRLIRIAGAALPAVAMVLLAGCATAPADITEIELDFPSPDSGPGRPALDKAAKRHIDDGWQALKRGDAVAARSSAARAGASAATRLLELQSEIVAGGTPVDELDELTRDAPDYAAAWITLSVAAENDANELVALQAADRGAALWSNARWAQRSSALRTRWVDERILAAQKHLAEGEPDAALTTVTPAIELDPDNREAVLVQARALTEVDQLDRAEAVLATLSRDREVVLLSGAIAEKRGDRAAAIRIYSSMPNDSEAVLMAVEMAEDDSDWQTAMDLYSLLPDDHPEKASGLREAQLRWRVSVMPSYVRNALSTNELTRSDLAVLMVTLAPRVETLPRGQVPLLSDIVDMPSQREIITAASLGLITVDRLDHRFYPERAASEWEIRSAISNLGRLLDTPEPTWCSDEFPDGCVALVEPVPGEQVADLIIHMLAGDSG